MHEFQGHHVIEVDELTRVEGQGALYIKVEDGRVTDSRFRIFEPPRFFEAFLVGRRFEEVPDLTARICGICPVAYQMSSCHALESIFGALPTEDSAIAALRRLFYCGEWIESHSLHVFFLHLPDFLGKSSAVEIAAEEPALIESAIRIRQAGNAIIKTLGGRSMHPVGARVGGWYRAPRRSELRALKPALEDALERTLDAARRMAAELTFPEFEQDYEFVALTHPREYPFNRGEIASSRGWTCAVADFGDEIVERQVEHSNAWQATLKRSGDTYFLGPLARFALNRERLTPVAQALADELALGEPERNPYRGLLVRMVEIAFSLEEALAIIESYAPPAEASLPLDVTAGTGAWATEAPRGLLYHQYAVDEHGDVVSAKIIPPTSQNQARIEADLRALVESMLSADDHSLSHACEFMIRNYDPCISCATHFLAFRIDR